MWKWKMRSVHFSFTAAIIIGKNFPRSLMDLENLVAMISANLWSKTQRTLQQHRRWNLSTNDERRPHISTCVRNDAPYRSSNSAPKQKNFKICFACSFSVTFLGLISGLILNKSRLRSHYMTPINRQRRSLVVSMIIFKHLLLSFFPRPFSWHLTSPQV